MNLFVLIELYIIDIQRIADCSWMRFRMLCQIKKIGSLEFMSGHDVIFFFIMLNVSLVDLLKFVHSSNLVVIWWFCQYFLDMLRLLFKNDSPGFLNFF